MKNTPSAKLMNFIQRLVAAWINEIGLHGYVGHPEELFEHPEVIKRVNKLRPATLGIIAWQGVEYGKQGDGTGRRTPLYEVHCGSYLGKYLGGRELLRTLARTAIAAEMFDQLGQPYQDWREPSAGSSVKVPIASMADLHEAGEE